MTERGTIELYAADARETTKLAKHLQQVVGCKLGRMVGLRINFIFSSSTIVSTNPDPYTD